MKNIKLLLATTAMLSMGLAVNVYAITNQYTVGTANFDAHATFVNPLTIGFTSPMDFGALSGAVKGDTVTLQTNNMVSKTGTVTLLNGNYGLAWFNVSNATEYDENYQTDSHFVLTIPDLELSTSADVYCGYISEFHASGEKSSSTPEHYTTTQIVFNKDGSLNGGHYLGGTLHIDDHGTKTLTSVPTGHCSGTGTLTAIYYAE